MLLLKNSLKCCIILSTCCVVLLWRAKQCWVRYSRFIDCDDMDPKLPGKYKTSPLDLLNHDWASWPKCLQNPFGTHHNPGSVIERKRIYNKSLIFYPWNYSSNTEGIFMRQQKKLSSAFHLIFKLPLISNGVYSNFF